MRTIGFLILSVVVVVGLVSPVRDAAAQARGQVIQRVVVEGTQRIDPETIGSYLRLGVGDRFDRAKMDESLKALFATGLFRDVTVRQEGSTLLVRVVENPIINRIVFEGNSKVNSSDLAQNISLRARSVYTRAKVQAAVTRLLGLYRTQGRFGATITPKVIQRPQNRVDLVFEINEGEVTGIRRISFIGNKAFSDSELRGVVQTRESAWWRFFGSRDVYDPQRLNFDKELLRRFYLARGHAEFRVISAVAELTPDRKNFFITFTVFEGPVYKFGKPTVDTQLKGTQAAQFEGALNFKEGDRFNADKIETVVNSMTDIAGTLGYAFVQVQPQTSVDREAKTVTIDFQIREGPRVFVERVEIVGNQRTRDEVIRREVLLAEGDAFNTSKIRLSKRRLDNLGFFSKVEINNRPGSAPDKTIVTVTVEEKATGELTLGAGFSTQEGVLGTFGIRERNFMGRGQDLSLQFLISQRSTGLDLSFTEPYFLGRNLSLGVDLFRRTRSFEDESGFDVRDTGFRIRFGYRFTEHLSQQLRYELRNNTIRNISSTASPYIQSEEGTNTTSAIGQTLSYDTRDNRFDPTEGLFLSLSADFAGLGGSESWVKLIGRGAYYYSVVPGWVVSVSGEVGTINGLGKAVPLGERFFLGGNSFRGFRFGGVGPRDLSTDDGLGGTKYYVVTGELSFPTPLPKEIGLRARVWVDVGSNWDSPCPSQCEPNPGPPVFDTSTPRVSIGVGFSWRSPLGPVRFDLGFPIVKQGPDETQIFNFTFGTRF